MANDVIGKIIQIKYLDKAHEKANSQIRRNTAALGGIDSTFKKLKVDATWLRGLNESLYLIRTFQDGQYFTKPCLEMPLLLGDIVVTGAGVVCGIEFLIGGRVGMSPQSAIVVQTERSVRDISGEPRVVLRKGGTWAKSVNLKEPLEIQTNGGILGIKDSGQTR
jgi:hypothetical protein